MSEEDFPTCPHCGVPGEPGTAYCPDCGTAIPAPPPAARGGEDASPDSGIVRRDGPIRPEPPVAEPASGGAGSPGGPQAAPSGSDALLKMLESILAMQRNASAPAPVSPAPASAQPAAPAAPAAVASVPGTDGQEEVRTLRSTHVSPGPTVLTIVPPQPAPSRPREPQTVDARKWAPPPVPLSAPSAPRLSDEELVPFTLEWDAIREFVEGVSSNFAVRVRCRRRIYRLHLLATVNGEELAPVVLRDLEPGDWREERFGYVPKEKGEPTVRLCAMECSEGGSRERFEVLRPFEHRVHPFRSLLPVGATNINIDNRDNSGIIRLDSLRIPVQEMENLRENIDRTLAKKDGWQNAPVGPGKVLRNCVLLQSADRDLLVVAGLDRVTFGMHSSRPLVALSAETPEGLVDDRRGKLVSRIHFSVQMNRQQRRFELADGGPAKDDPSKWSPSSNHTRVDGTDAASPRPLLPDRTYEVELAPGTVSGGPALRLALQTKGWDDPAAEGCSRVGNLSSLLVRYPDNPRRLALVVWGGASLGDFLGGGPAPVVRNWRGRLLFDDRRPGGRPRRLRTFEGGKLPGTPFFVL